ncbi:thioredoxin domain-containing protein [Hypericibacter adhaerens]|uniref:Thioredoxin domain-containing protein n=1 Tax=Hypericibacter adhaerens TaxID=2602016 RepID=A0A5J6N5C6_9PROT|nr:thioredoxin domain-containing protein [Hypericibacter adhaerens]QEX25108.1 thioredoxin domain-containing protein [Hypericibacter adhaerens]
MTSAPDLPPSPASPEVEADGIARLAANQLGLSTSPYLHQHQANPVHWQVWDPATLAAARALDRPILLSVGYAACHWCHVMAHESFENEATAALMNELFVNIKVDREERPDVDQIYQAALALLGQQGGWPLTMFLTPQGEPFWGGTYFPPAERWGRPGFPDVLKTIAGIYRGDRGKVANNVTALRDALASMSEPRPGGAISMALIDRIAEHLLQQVDEEHGGIGGAPKFPQEPSFELLWRGWKRTGETGMRDAVLLTLTHMAQGGIYDHLGGGFARYSVDAEWLVPHFEKMLYDNAQLVEQYALIWQETKSPLYEARVRETVGWALREMRAEGGPSGNRGFASSLDADSEHEEGKFYVWTEAEIDAALGADAVLFKRIYDVRPEGNWEHKTILNRSAHPDLMDEFAEGALQKARARLFQIRENRVRPGFDDKALADWNGLMIAALAFAAEVFDEPAWLEAACEAFAFVTKDMTREGRLRHSYRGGRLQHPATLDDYANNARAALRLHEATGDPAYLTQAETWVETLDRHYWDKNGGGYFFAADDTTDLVHRPRNANDNAVPSGNGTMVAVLARLHYLTGKPAYRDRAEALVGAFAGEIERNFFPLATLLNANDLLQNALQVVLVGDPASPLMGAMRRAVFDVSLPNLVLQSVATGTALPEGHPAAGKTVAAGSVAAFVCRGQTCSLPFTEPERLKAALALG